MKGIAMLGRTNITECMELLRMAHIAADDVVVAQQIAYVYNQLRKEYNGIRSDFNRDRMERVKILQKHGILLSDRSGQEEEGLYREIQYRLANTIYCVCSINGEIITIGKVREE